jgi:hypothetical protein
MAELIEGYSRNINGARTRVGGSGFTAFFWRTKPIGFCRQIAHTSPTPVGPGPTPIHPLDEPYPIEVITPAAQNIGTLTLELYELYNHKVWDSLSAIAGAVDLVNIFIRMAAMDEDIQVVKLISPPKLRGTTIAPYAERFHRCVITNVEDGETIEIGTMEVTKRITVAYTHMTRDGADANAAVQLRNGRANTVAGGSSPL